MAESETGRWVPTFATDVTPGDKIRTDGKTERYVLSRTFTDSFVPTFRIEFNAGGGSIRKTDVVEIWDESGEVSQRVQDLSARALR